MVKALQKSNRLPLQNPPWHKYRLLLEGMQKAQTKVQKLDCTEKNHNIPLDIRYKGYSC
jgi:hypothetical protein